MNSASEMSGGAIFIISIPTEQYEHKLVNKPRKLFNKRTSVDTKDGSASTERPSTPTMDAEYGTFADPWMPQSQDQSKKKTPLSRVSTAVNIGYDDISPVSRCGSGKPNDGNRFGSAETGLKHELLRSKSFDRGLNSPSAEKKTINLCPTDATFSRKSWDGAREIVSSITRSAGAQSFKTSKNQTPIIGSERRSLQLSSDTAMELIMIELLKKLKIDNAFWQSSRNRHFYQITFTIDDYRQEILLNILNEWGIGEREGSTVSMVPCPLYNKPNDENGADGTSMDFDLTLAQKQTAWNRFMKSVRARLNVAQIVHAVKQDATLTFDFVVLLTIAALLAAFGLIENSTVFLASSMLISPLMGPIIATIFGIVIKDRCLARLGLVNEMIGISLATFVGFCFGLMFCWIDDRYAYGDFNGITSEMKDRGELHSLILGVLTAIPSGAAVAIAILGENIGSLVGVAISASLLPPAVNSGILWSLSLIYICHEADPARYNRIINSTTYSENQAAELAIHGGVSMLITFVNIICIWVIGIIVLKIKEVAPVVSKGQRQFWKYDIKVARDYNKTCQSDEDLELIAHEIADFQGGNEVGPGFGKMDFLRTIDRSSYQKTWSPMGSRSGMHSRDTKPTLAELEKLYVEMTRPARDTGYGYATFMGQHSPPQYRSVEDHIFQPALRRASMPFNSMFGMPAKVNVPTFQFRGPQLERINEVSCASCGNLSEGAKPNEALGGEKSQVATSNANKKKRKFIVTPASDI